MGCTNDFLHGDKGGAMKNIVLKPRPHFYQTFRIYKPDRKCAYCGQKIKSKRPNVEFYFMGFVKNSLNMLKVKVTGRKGIWRIHRGYFMPFA